MHSDLNISVKCFECGHIFQANKYFDQKKVFAGHIRWCSLFKKNNATTIRTTIATTMEAKSKSKRIRKSSKWAAKLHSDIGISSQITNDNGLEVQFEDTNFYDISSSYNEFESMGENLTDDRLIVDETKVSTVYFNKQLEYYSKLVDLSSKENSPENGLQFESDEFLILKLKYDLGLSNREGNMVLDLIHKILERKGITCNHLPKTIETIEDHCNAEFNSRHCKEIDETENQNIKTFSFSIHEVFFPLLKEKRQTFGYFFDILQIISQSLLVTNEKDFVCEPDIRIIENNGTKERLYEDFTTGDYFENATHAIRKHSKNNKAVFLAIGVTCDESTVKSRSKSETPVCIYILNCINSAFRMHLVGYIPKSLPYTESEINVAYPDLKLGIRRKILEMLNREMRLQYISEILKPLLNFSEYGLKLMIGSPSNQNVKIITAFPHISMITADSKECSNLSGISYNSKNCKCRICLVSDCISLKPISAKQESQNFRDDKTSMNLCIEGYAAVKQHMSGMSEEIKTIYENLYKVNLKPGKNPLYDIFEWQNERKILSFHQALVPDYLHTITKGLIENCIAMTMACLLSIQEIDKRYINNIQTIDDRIKLFPSIQSLEIMRRFRFSKGISGMFYKTWNSSAKNSNKGTGFVSGSVESWKLPILLYQLMFCINIDIVPFDKNWYKNIGSKCSWRWNPGQIIMNAITSMFDMHIFCLKTILTNRDVEVTLCKLISNCNAQQCLLWLMRKDLVDSCVKDKEPSVKQAKPDLSKVKMENFRNAVKPHLSTHIPFYKKFFGADRRCYDTELSEKSHIVNVKEVYERSNKSIFETQKQMLKQIYKRQSLNNSSLLKMMHHDAGDLVDNSNIYTNVIFPPEDEVLFQVIFSFGYEIVEISYDNSLKITPAKIYKDTIKNKTFKRMFGGSNTDLPAKCEAFNKDLLTFNEFSDLLCSDFGKLNPENSFMRLLQSRRNEFKLVKCVKRFYSKTPDDNFRIVCDNSYRRYQGSSMESKCILTNVSSFVEIKWQYHNDHNTNMQSKTDIAQVISIINFSHKNDSVSNSYLLIVWLEEIAVEKSKNLFPNFKQYKYNMRYSNLNRTKLELFMQIVPVESVYRPAHLINYSETGNNWDYKIETLKIRELTTIRFYSVPFLYAKRDTIQYSTNYTHWKYGTSINYSDNTFKHNQDVQNTGRQNIKDNKHVHADISERVYSAFLEENEINEIDGYLQNRFTNDKNNDKYISNGDDSSEDSNIEDNEDYLTDDDS
jgi:hypothetical protein